MSQDQNEELSFSEEWKEVLFPPEGGMIGYWHFHPDDGSIGKTTFTPPKGRWGGKVGTIPAGSRIECLDCGKVVEGPQG